MEKLLRVAEMRDLEQQVAKGKISYSRMVEIINEKHFHKLCLVRGEYMESNKTPQTVVVGTPVQFVCTHPNCNCAAYCTEYFKKK